MSDPFFKISKEMREKGAVNYERIEHFYVYYNAEGLRWCGRAKHWLHPLDFHKASQWCKTCRTAYFKANYDAEEARKRNFRYYYGEEYATYEYFFVLQGGKCAICKSPPQVRKIGRNRTEVDHFCLDHDHVTGRARGLLCHRCNWILGWMRDNPSAVDNVRKYLEGEGKAAS